MIKTYTVMSRKAGEYNGQKEKMVSGVFIAGYVAPDGFAKHLRVAVNVEVIVL